MAYLPTSYPATDLDADSEFDQLDYILHAAYLNLQEEMAHFQQTWENDPAAAFTHQAKTGWNVHGAEWLQTQTVIFNAKEWISLAKEIVLTQSKSDEWSWQKTLLDQKAQVNSTSPHAPVTGNAPVLIATATYAQALYEQRELLCELPELLAEAKPRRIKTLLAEELRSIDPDLADDIRQDPHFPEILRLLHEEKITDYLSYTFLAMDNLPPNFFAFMAGKGAIYLLLETQFLLIMLAICPSPAADIRTQQLIDRIKTVQDNIATGVEITCAIEAYIRLLEDMRQAANIIHREGIRQTHFTPTATFELGSGFETPPAPPPKDILASIQRRIAATLIDLVCMLIPFIMLVISAFKLSSPAGKNGLQVFLYLILLALFTLLIPAFLDAWGRGSIGKQIMKIRVVNHQGEKPSLFAALFRHIVKFSSHLLGPVVLRIFECLVLKGRSLHEVITQSWVVHKDSNPKDIIAAIRPQKGSN